MEQQSCFRKQNSPCACVRTAACLEGRCRDVPQPSSSAFQPWVLAISGTSSPRPSNCHPCCTCADVSLLLPPALLWVTGGDGRLGLVWFGQGSTGPALSCCLPSPCCFCKAFLGFACEEGVICSYSGNYWRKPDAPPGGLNLAKRLGLIVGLGCSHPSFFPMGQLQVQHLTEPAPSPTAGCRHFGCLGPATGWSHLSQDSWWPGDILLQGRHCQQMESGTG